MSILAEFKTFAIKGNAMDLAVGVIIGGAFGKIVDSIVNDLVMPVVSGIIGKPDFSDWFIVLGTLPEGVARDLAEIRKAGIPVLAYGNFITVAINFILLAFVVFLIVKMVNKLRKPEVNAGPKPPTTEELLTDIRDLIRDRKE